ncbi:hypothetical protein [Rhizobium ruizarguesonis]|uniref:hypothetical protein n=1 Tax=Rhizobium ruizarguesonis TaxID=2081791 RepID=UPI0013EE837F|nr:hypothetical protein [Rhizobium ruizarguesonis]
MHAFFDGEVVFARDVVQVNFDLSPFPVDFDSVWSWGSKDFGVERDAGYEFFIERNNLGRVRQMEQVPQAGRSPKFVINGRLKAMAI